MRDLFATYEEIGKLPSLSPEDDPFVDVFEPIMLGEGYYRLEPLSYLINNPAQVNLVATSFEFCGKLDLDIIPVDPDGSEDLPDELIPNEPEDLIDQRLDFIVKIDGAKDLPQNFCRDIFAEYSFYLNDKTYRTEVVKGKNRNPEFNYAKQHTVDICTDNLVNYLKKECMVFKVYGFPDTKNKFAGDKKLNGKQQSNHSMSDMSNSTIDNSNTTSDSSKIE